MLKLSEMGFDEINTDFVSDVPQFKQRVVNDVSGENFMIDWLADHPTFRIKEAVAHFKADGRSAGSCYTAARILVQRKLLNRLGEGNYTRAGVKAIAPPKKASPKKGVARVVYDPPHPVFAYRLMSRNHGRCTRIWLKDQFEKDKRPAQSAPSALADLVNSGQAKRVGEGEYELTRKKEKKAKVKPVAKTNGANAETAHGNG
jgi:hypothetical protein